MMLVPSPQGWGTTYLDDASIDTLHIMIQEASRKYGLVGKKFVVGGFSIGGTGALRYAERIIEKGMGTLTLVGAFAVPGIRKTGWQGTATQGSPGSLLRRT